VHLPLSLRGGGTASASWRRGGVGVRVRVCRLSPDPWEKRARRPDPSIHRVSGDGMPDLISDRTEGERSPSVRPPASFHRANKRRRIGITTGNACLEGNKNQAPRGVGCRWVGGWVFSRSKCSRRRRGQDRGLVFCTRLFFLFFLE
jgi:hypothetical protein